MANGRRTSSSSFLAKYIELVAHADPSEIATWLFTNARTMDKAMFYDSNNDWLSLEPHHILVLRAVTPDGVFVPVAMSGYLARVQGNPDRSAIADSLFSGDYEFVLNLPAEVRAELIQLMQLAYRKGIRPADPRVKAM